MQILLIVIVLIIIGALIYMQHPRFGGKIEGTRLERMKSSAQYKEGAFENIEHTPPLVEGSSTLDIWKQFLFGKVERKHPTTPIPVVKTNLKALNQEENVFIWFGHSSYYIQLDGQRILVDPVFSTYASPVRYSIKAFDYSYEYTAEDMPKIDVLIITHDHWDHLDYNTFLEIKDKVQTIITSLGVGAHLEAWGFPADRIHELYWGETFKLSGIDYVATTSRHFSGRTFKRNTTLWSSFVVSGSKRLYIGGDSGYGQHFKMIGEQYGPFDYAFLDNGQYNDLWKYIHMLPEEVPVAAADLNAKSVIPVHSSKYPLALHAWDEPLIRVKRAFDNSTIPLLTPRIGQVLNLDSTYVTNDWWTGIE